MRVNNYITENDLSMMNHDTATKFYRQISSPMKFNKQIFNNKTLNRYTVNNPKASKLNAQIKIHEENEPIRPVINFTKAPSYKISKIIADELKDKINRNNNHSVKNSMELTDRISTPNVSTNTKLFSFDIKNMYPNIPINESI
nr:uncharacterized protein LOC111513411 [Leptinotarsa decemlineata]